MSLSAGEGKLSAQWVLGSRHLQIGGHHLSQAGAGTGISVSLHLPRWMNTALTSRW